MLLGRPDPRSAVVQRGNDLLMPIALTARSVAVRLTGHRLLVCCDDEVLRGVS